MTEFEVIKVFKSPDNGEMFATITISNTDIKNIQAAITWYQGDKDDLNNEKKMEQLRQHIHDVWKVLNPS